METHLAYYQARLATFQGAATKSRRPSSRSKKAAPKSKAAWPLSAPSAEDLAYAGFVWKPTSASPDNVQCWACNCQLDGWEEADVPAYEHLTHSPSCGFATVLAIRLRHGDPGRTEDDPTSDAMVSARKDTFSDLWPLDPAAGYPSVEQLAAAGWFYDPANDMPDGVTCPYCDLSLDAWDAGDDPMEEHRRRASDCLFFSLAELYHPPTKPEPKAKAKRTTTSKRTSSRSSTASNATTATKKTTRGKKRISDAVEDDTQISITTKKTTRGKKRASEVVEDNSQLFESTTKATRGRTRASEAIGDYTQMSVKSDLTKKTTRGKKRASEAIDDTQMSELPTKKATRGKKRTSEAIEDDTHMFDSTHDTSKRMRFSSMSSLPDDLLAGTPKKMPSELDTEPFIMSSLPASLLVGTPKRTPPHLRVTEEPEAAWQPVDLDAFLSNQKDVRGFVNDVMIDAGLDEITATGTTPEEIQAAVMAGLTDAEKGMTIEQWVMYNAKRGEEKLRMACEQQIAAFEAEGKRALAMLEAIPTY
ncbi:inhibitor of apoptosis repeat-containing protein [Ophiobolus disseminans]|uniref:Inhibitor of apoptosis repeat-containing protein n=1 Tax=Ophiobolus disseminans TaxID=1469910 RepID=A0A6A7ACQ8_9PLEO|nr:inhibitor of apoptosis repeat-containing protein [Ophiobolus disseminans]